MAHNGSWHSLSPLTGQHDGECSASSPCEQGNHLQQMVLAVMSRDVDGKQKSLRKLSVTDHGPDSSGSWSAGGGL